MGKLNFVLTNFLFWPIIALTAVLLSSFQFQPGSFYDGYSDLVFFLIAGFIVLLTVIYYVVEHRLNKFKVHPLLFPIIFFLFGISIASIWIAKVETFVNPDTGYTVMVIPSILQKVKFSIVTLLFFSSIYMMTFMFSRKTFRVKQMFWFLRAYVLFVIISIVFSIINDFESLKDIFVHSGGTHTQLLSFFFNENLFALFILYGIFALMILNLFHSRIYNYAFIVIFYFYMLLTTCTTTFIVGSAAVIIYVVFDLVRNVKKHWILTLVVASCLTLFISGLIMVVTLAYNNDVEWVVNFFDYIQEEVISKNFSTLTGRTAIWQNVWDNLISTDIVTLLIGRGFGISDMVLKGYALAGTSGNVSSAILSTHNGLLGIVLSNGLIGLGFYALLIVVAVIAIIYLICKKKASFAVTFGICIFGVLAHSMAETVSFFGMSMLGIVVALLFMIPLFNGARVTKSTKFEKQATEGDFVCVKMQHRKFRRFVSTLLLGAFIPVLCLMISKGTSLLGGLEPYLTTLLILLGVTYLLGPQILTMFYKDASNKSFMFRLFFYPILAIVLFVSLMITANFVEWLSFVLTYTKISFIIFVAAYELILFVIFTLIKKDKFVQYLSDISIHTLKLVKIALPVCIGVGLLSNFFLDLFIAPSLLSVICLAVIPFALYYLLLATIPSKEKYYYVSYLNERALYSIKRTALKYYI